MPKKYKINERDIEKVTEARKKTNNKQEDKRMQAVILRGQGLSDKAIAERLETSSDMVSRWISLYAKEGINGLLTKPSPGRPLQISFEEEAKMLAEFEAKAEAGQIVEVSDIEAAYTAKVGHNIGSGQIYRVLKRHKWRKIKPRSRHPKKATPEVINASKKLTLA